MQHESKQTVCMEKPMEMAWVGPHVGRGEVSRSHQGGVTSVSYTNGDLDMMAAEVYKAYGEGFSKGTRPSTSTSVWERTTAPALTLKPDNQFLPMCSWCSSREPPQLFLPILSHRLQEWVIL